MDQGFVPVDAWNPDCIQEGSQAQGKALETACGSEHTPREPACSKMEKSCPPTQANGVGETEQHQPQEQMHQQMQSSESLPPATNQGADGPKCGGSAQHGIEVAQVHQDGATADAEGTGNEQQMRMEAGLHGAAPMEIDGNPIGTVVNGAQVARAPAPSACEAAVGACEPAVGACEAATGAAPVSTGAEGSNCQVQEHTVVEMVTGNGAAAAPQACNLTTENANCGAATLDQLQQQTPTDSRTQSDHGGIAYTEQRHQNPQEQQQQQQQHILQQTEHQQPQQSSPSEQLQHSGPQNRTLPEHYAEQQLHAPGEQQEQQAGQAQTRPFPEQQVEQQQQPEQPHNRPPPKPQAEQQLLAEQLGGQQQQAEQQLPAEQPQSKPLPELQAEQQLQAPGGQQQLLAEQQQNRPLPESLAEKQLLAEQLGGQQQQAEQQLPAEQPQNRPLPELQAEQQLQAPGGQQQQAEQLLWAEQQQNRPLPESLAEKQLLAEQLGEQQQQTGQQQQPQNRPLPEPQAEQQLQAPGGQHQTGAEELPQPGFEEQRADGPPPTHPLPPPNDSLQQTQKQATGGMCLQQSQQHASGEQQHLQQAQQQAAEEQHLLQPQQHAVAEKHREGLVHELQTPGKQQLQHTFAQWLQQAEQLCKEKQPQQDGQQPQQQPQQQQQQSQPVHEPQHRPQQLSQQQQQQQQQQQHEGLVARALGVEQLSERLAAQAQPKKEQCQTEEQQAQHTKPEECKEPQQQQDKRCQQQQQQQQQQQPQPTLATGRAPDVEMAEARVTGEQSIPTATPAGGNENCAGAAAPQLSDSPCLSISVSGLEAGEILPDADATSQPHSRHLDVQGASSRRRSEDLDSMGRGGVAAVKASERVRRDEERHRGAKGLSVSEREGKASISRGPASGGNASSKRGEVGRVSEHRSGGSSRSREDSASSKAGVSSREGRQVEITERGAHRVSMEWQRSKEVGACEQHQHHHQQQLQPREREREKERERSEGSRQKVEGQRGSGYGPPVMLELQPIDDESGGKVAVRLRVASYALTLSELKQRGGRGGRDERSERQSFYEKEGLQGREKRAEHERVPDKHTQGVSHYKQRGRSSPGGSLREWERSRSRSQSRHTHPPASASPRQAPKQLPPPRAGGALERDHKPPEKLPVREWKKREELEQRKEREEWERERREREQEQELTWALKRIEAEEAQGQRERLKRAEAEKEWERERAWKRANAAAEAVRRQELLREQEELERERERERGRTLGVKRAREHDHSLSRLRDSPPPPVVHRSRDGPRARSPPPPMPTHAPYTAVPRDLMVPPTRAKAAYPAVPDPLDLIDPLPPPRRVGRHLPPEPRPRSWSPLPPYPRPMHPTYGGGYERGRVLPMGAMLPLDYDPYGPPPLPRRPYAMDPYDDPFIDDSLYGSAPRGREMLRGPPSPLRPLPRRSRSRSPLPLAPHPHPATRMRSRSPPPLATHPYAPPRAHPHSSAPYPPPEGDPLLPRSSRGGASISGSRAAYDAALPRRPTSTPAEPPPRGYVDPSDRRRDEPPTSKHSTAYPDPRTFSPPRSTRGAAYADLRAFSPPRNARSAAYADPRALSPPRGSRGPGAYAELRAFSPPRSTRSAAYADPRALSPPRGSRGPAYPDPRAFSPPRGTRGAAYAEPRALSPPCGPRGPAYAEPRGAGAYADPRALSPPRSTRSAAYADPPPLSPPHRSRSGAAYAEPPLLSPPHKRARAGPSPPPRARSISPPPRARAVATVPSSARLPPPPSHVPPAEFDPTYDRLAPPRSAHVPYGPPPIARQHPVPARHREREQEERGRSYSRGRSAAPLPPRSVADDKEDKRVARLAPAYSEPKQGGALPPAPLTSAAVEEEELYRRGRPSSYDVQARSPPRGPGYYPDSSRSRRPYSPPPLALPNYTPALPRGSRMPSPPPPLPPPQHPMDRSGAPRSTYTHTRASNRNRPRSPPPPVDDGRAAKRSRMDPLPSEGTAQEARTHARAPAHPSPRAPAPPPAYSRTPAGPGSISGGVPEGGGGWRSRSNQPRMAPSTPSHMRPDAAPAPTAEPYAMGRGMMTAATVYDHDHDGRVAGVDGGSRSGGYGPPPLSRGGVVLPSSHMRGGGAGGPERAPMTPSAAAFDEDAKVWYYRDPAGNQQGPCSVAQFKLWITNMARDPGLAAQLEQFKSVDVWDNESLRPVQLITLLKPS